MGDNELMPVSEAAKIANVDPKTILNAIDRGVLPFTRKPVGNRMILVRPKMVLSAVADGRIKPGGQVWPGGKQG